MLFYHAKVLMTINPLLIRSGNPLVAYWQVASDLVFYQALQYPPPPIKLIVTNQAGYDRKGDDNQNSNFQF